MPILLPQTVLLVPAFLPPCSLYNATRPQTMPSLAGLLRLASQGALALLPSSVPLHTTTTTATAATATSTATTSGVITPSLRGLAPHSPAAALSPKSTTAEGPIDLGTGTLTWTGTHKEIRVNGKSFKLKGLSWFGFEVRVHVQECVCLSIFYPFPPTSFPHLRRPSPDNNLYSSQEPPFSLFPHDRHQLSKNT